MHIVGRRADGRVAGAIGVQRALRVTALGWRSTFEISEDFHICCRMIEILVRLSYHADQGFH
jgi:hypothetical protein